MSTRIINDPNLEVYLALSSGEITFDEAMKRLGLDKPIKADPDFVKATNENFWDLA
ncbi:MAG: hypothetical protein OEX19_16035 [Gammaproteobacteria bacterium]|nr:hypothetical protein [Gammaproteobacteria bacterium]